MKTTSQDSKAGLQALLTPDNCVLILIDHQPFQFAGLRSHDTQTIINNVVALAKSAKIFGVPTLLTTVLEKQGGFIIKQEKNRHGCAVDRDLPCHARHSG